MAKKKRSAFKRAKRTASLATVALALGGVIGVAIGLLKAPKKGAELKDDLSREAERIWKKLKITKKQVDATVKKTLGEVSPETLRVYAKAKSEILTRVAKYKDGITKKHYEEIVDSVVKRVTKSKRLKPGLKKLSKEFKGMWKNISSKL